MTAEDHPWRVPPQKPVLASNEVHAWKVSLSLETEIVNSLKRFLSNDERSRARRFYFSKDRNHYIAARGILRIILAGYLGREPDELCFRYNPQGKAMLKGPDETLRFNVSHSGDTALYAMSWNRSVGIDIEQIRPEIDFSQIAEFFFSPREVTELHLLPESIQKEAFFRCWTRKEAYIKARGQGLALSLDRFSVSLAPGQPAALLESREDPEEASRWSLRELSPDPGSMAALAVEGHDWRLRCWQWRGK